MLAGASGGRPGKGEGATHLRHGQVIRTLCGTGGFSVGQDDALVVFPHESSTARRTPRAKATKTTIIATDTARHMAYSVLLLTPPTALSESLASSLNNTREQFSLPSRDKAFTLYTILIS